MKVYHSLITLFLFTQSLLLFSPKSANAQLSCQETVNDVVDQIQELGIPEVKTDVEKGTANGANTGNPTNRQDVVAIAMVARYDDRNFYVIDNIMNSSQLMNNWADSIVKVCGGTAVVSFGQYGTSWVAEYAIQSDLSTRLRDCITPLHEFPWSWNESLCDL